MLADFSKNFSTSSDGFLSANTRSSLEPTSKKRTLGVADITAAADKLGSLAIENKVLV